MENRLLLYFLPLQWTLNSRVQLAATKSEELSALDHLVAKGLQEGNDIQDDESLINLSMIMTNMAPEEAKVPESVFTHLDLYLTSLLTHSTKSSRFCLLIIRLNRLAKKGNDWAPMNVFLLTSLTRVNVWRRHTLPATVSWKVPEITFWMGKWKMVMEA